MLVTTTLVSQKHISGKLGGIILVTTPDHYEHLIFSTTASSTGQYVTYCP